MTDAVILALVAALMFFAVRGAVKHFKGESPCCGGGGSGLTKAPAEKRLDSPVLGRKTVKISGMHCDHCVRSVTEAINKIDGASAKGKPQIQNRGSLLRPPRRRRKNPPRSRGRGISGSFDKGVENGKTTCKAAGREKRPAAFVFLCACPYSSNSPSIMPLR